MHILHDFFLCIVDIAWGRLAYTVYGNTETESSSGVKIKTKNSYRKKDANVLQRFDGTRKEKQLAWMIRTGVESADADVVSIVCLVTQRFSR